MPVKKYDVIFSLGSACLCSQMLRKLHLQFCSFPLDWVTGDDFSNRVELLASDFRDFFNKEDLVFYPDWQESKKDVYRNKRTQIIFPHDFPKDVPFETSYPVVRKKYDRRIARLIAQIEKAADVLIVYVDRPSKEQKDVPEDALKSCYARIADRFPNKNIDLLYIFCSDGESEQKIGDHIFKASCDYSEDATPPYKLVRLRAFVKSRGYKLQQNLYDLLRNLVFKIRKKIKKARAEKSTTK